MGRRQGIGGDVWNIFILEKKDAENQFFLHLFVWGSESGREWVLRRPGAGAGGGGSRINKGIKENKGINGIKKKCEKMSLGCARILVDEGA